MVIVMDLHQTDDKPLLSSLTHWRHSASIFQYDTFESAVERRFQMLNGRNEGGWIDA